MPVPLSTAVSSHKALSGGSAGNLFTKLQKNTAIHDHSHWSEQAARAALAQKTTCGHYFVIKEEKMLRHKAGVEDDKPAGPMSRKAAKNWEPYTKTSRLAVDAEKCLDIVHQVLARSTAAYNQPTKQPNARFVLIGAMPSGFGGETLSRDAPPARCDWVAIVITAGGVVNTAVVTHFPCTTDYKDAQTDLV